MACTKCVKVVAMLLCKHNEKKTQISMPFHSGKEVKKGLPNGILKQADIKTDRR